MPPISLADPARCWWRISEKNAPNSARQFEGSATTVGDTWGCFVRRSVRMAIFAPVASAKPGRQDEDGVVAATARSYSRPWPGRKLPAALAAASSPGTGKCQPGTSSRRRAAYMLDQVTTAPGPGVDESTANGARRTHEPDAHLAAEPCRPPKQADEANNTAPRLGLEVRRAAARRRRSSFRS